MNSHVANPISAFAATAAGARLAPFTIERRPVGPRDVLIEIDYCGVCHTDLHFVNNDWGMSAFPMVPGHEIIGRVVSMGADEVLLSTDAQAMAAWTGKFDFLLNTIPVPHDFNTYMMLLKRDRTMCIVGAIGPTANLNTAPLIMGRRNVAGSLIGGLKETQEMLDFAGRHNIVADVEVIDIATINEAFGRMQRSDVKYRFVIDLATLG